MVVSSCFSSLGVWSGVPISRCRFDLVPYQPSFDLNLSALVPSRPPLDPYLSASRSSARNCFHQDIVAGQLDVGNLHLDVHPIVVFSAPYTVLHLLLECSLDLVGTELGREYSCSWLEPEGLLHVQDLA